MDRRRASGPTTYCSQHLMHVSPGLSNHTLSYFLDRDQGRMNRTGFRDTTPTARKGGVFTPLANFLASPMSSDAERAASVLIFAALLLIRQPRILSQGRFWAEEGRVFFERAWTLPWNEALFLPYGGYLNIVANAGGVLARYLVRLRAAPYVTTSIALTIQCIPAILIVISRVDWLQRRIIIAAALAIIATVPFSYEVNLSTIGSQFYLALAAAIILALEARSGAFGVLQFLVLFVAPLSGPASWALAPLFAFRALAERSRLRAFHALTILSGMLLQVVFFFSPVHGRGIGISPTLLGAIVLAKHVVAPIMYDRWAVGVIKSFAPLFTNAGGPIWPLALVTLLTIGALVVTARDAAKSPLWLFSAGVSIALISYVGALGEKIALVGSLSGGRYALAPQTLFALSLLSWSVLGRGPIRQVGRYTVVWLIIVGVLDYRLTQFGPPWPHQVEKWQTDKSYELQIWPSGWTMSLPSK